MLRRREKGFTLIELMIVVVIIGILAAMAIPRFMATTVKAKQSEARTILKQVYTMQLPYRQQYDAYWGNGVSAFANGAATSFTPIGVDIQANALYTYTMTIANGTSFVCTAICTNLDDDNTPDLWRIDNWGDLVCVSDDAAW